MAVPPDLGFLRHISTMADSWDYGLLEARQLTESAMALVAVPHQNLLKSMATFTAARNSVTGPLTDFAALNPTAGLVSLLRSWRETSESGLGLLCTLARAAYLAALRARDAPC